MEEIRRLAEPLRGARVLHVNATSYGGGVAEILHNLRDHLKLFGELRTAAAEATGLAAS